MSYKPCPACRGARLKPESLAVTIVGLCITDVTGLSVLHATRDLAEIAEYLRTRNRSRRSWSELQYCARSRT